MLRMDDETGLDVVGLAKLAKAITTKARAQLVDTACSTFRESVAPFTAVTSGIGRLIDAKSDRLVGAEKVLARNGTGSAAVSSFAATAHRAALAVRLN